MAKNDQPKRIFRRSSQLIGKTGLVSSVDRWEWTRSQGLHVVFTNGMKMKSDYTLRELLGPGKPEGNIIEVKP